MRMEALLVRSWTLVLARAGGVTERLIAARSVRADRRVLFCAESMSGEFMTRGDLKGSIVASSREGVEAGWLDAVIF